MQNRNTITIGANQATSKHLIPLRKNIANIPNLWQNIRLDEIQLKNYKYPADYRKTFLKFVEENLNRSFWNERGAYFS